MSSPVNPVNNNNPLPPQGIIELARILSFEMAGSLDDGTQDEAVARVRELTPVFWLSQAAMSLTGIDDPSKAVKHLFGDDELREHVIGQTKELERTMQLADADREVIPKRVEQLRELGLANSIMIADLLQGEQVTLFYKEPRDGNSLFAALEIMRHDSGDELENMGVTVRRTDGELLHDHRNKLKPGTTAFLGFQPTRDEFEPQLQRGTHPAWMSRMALHQGEVLERPASDQGFVLDQIYYGPTNQYPLFPE